MPSCVFSVLHFSSLPSTQTYLSDAISKGTLKAPIAVMAEDQYDGIGSRENRWEGSKGNFFASFAVDIAMLPKDLPIASASIYFSFIMKKLLSSYHQEVWLKWPNDLYVGRKKAGGTITKQCCDTLICGMGINLKEAPVPYGCIEVDISAKTLLEKYLEVLCEFPSWKQVFSEYRVEFEQSKGYETHIESEKMSLENASLCEDGSLSIDGKKVFSRR